MTTMHITDGNALSFIVSGPNITQNMLIFLFLKHFLIPSPELCRCDVQVCVSLFKGGRVGQTYPVMAPACNYI